MKIKQWWCGDLRTWISTNRFLLDQYVRIPQLILLKSFFYFIFLFPIPTLLILNTGNSGPYEKFCIGNNSRIRTFHLVTSFSDYPIKWSPTNFKHVVLLQNIFTLSAFSRGQTGLPRPPMLMVVMLRCPLGAIICTFDLTINSFYQEICE